MRSTWCLSLWIGQNYDVACAALHCCFWKRGSGGLQGRPNSEGRCGLSLQLARCIQLSSHAAFAGPAILCCRNSCHQFSWHHYGIISCGYEYLCTPGDCQSQQVFKRWSGPFYSPACTVAHEAVCAGMSFPACSAVTRCAGMGFLAECCVDMGLSCSPLCWHGVFLALCAGMGVSSSSLCWHGLFLQHCVLA